MNKPVFSVIVPIYNVEPYLGPCLDSLLAQTYSDFEAILVNDGSTDGSLRLAEDYAARDSRLRVLRHDQNRGISAARNTGLDAARGKYVCFLDSDDWFEPDLLEHSFAALEEDSLDLVRLNECEPGVPGAISQKAFCRDSGVCTGPALLCAEVAADAYSSGACIAAYRREFLLSHSLRFLEGHIYEDVPFSAECLLNAERARHLLYAGFHHRVRKNSIMTSRTQLRNVREAFLIMLEVYRLCKTYPITEETEAALVSPMDGMLYLMRLYNDRLKDGEWKQLKTQLSPADYRLFCGLMEPDAISQARLSTMKSSPDFRIGAAILYLPRLIWRPIFRFLKRRGRI